MTGVAATDVSLEFLLTVPMIAPAGPVRTPLTSYLAPMECSSITSTTLPVVAPSELILLVFLDRLWPWSLPPGLGGTDTL